MPQNTLGKHERLKSRKQIEFLFQQGQRFAAPPFRVFYVIKKKELKEATGSLLQFGVGASSRFFKKAVDRNCIKRLGREAWRLQKRELLQALEEQNKQLDVFFIYTGKELPAYAEVFAATTGIIQKLAGKIK
ncbi:MAG: ribonuclease P protein component [Sphingobacteriales bacterium]|nr:ribonuclease P protein component [Sphingobacteriales bacterium]OJW03061.1 MAG: ribonuclease P protein component [Sphingobacteriales bacterium 44-61]